MALFCGLSLSGSGTRLCPDALGEVARVRAEETAKGLHERLGCPPELKALLEILGAEQHQSPKLLLSTQSASIGRAQKMAPHS